MFLPWLSFKNKATMTCPLSVIKVFGTEELIVRHQSIWNRRVDKLSECLAHLGFHFRQRLCGVASAVVWWCFVWSFPFRLEWFRRVQSKHRRVSDYLGSRDSGGCCSRWQSARCWPWGHPVGSSFPTRCGSSKSDATVHSWMVTMSQKHSLMQLP